jgi:N-acetylneuraminate synthase
MNNHIILDGRTVGDNFPVYIVAEMSANHNQDYDRAVEIIRAAAEAGADAIKIQTYTPDTMTINSDKEYFQIGKGTIWKGKNLFDLYQEAYTPWDWQPKLKQEAEKVGIDFFSTPFDQSAVDFLEEMDVPVFKIASFENVDLALLRKVARTGKPIILSTGMATLAEIDEAVRTIRNNGGEKLILLKCTSAYPAPPEEMNLRTISHLAETFHVPAGLSDHTLGSAAAVAAVALGACLIEKHFTLSRDDQGPDSSFSMEPQEFRRMVDDIRLVEKALGKISYKVGEKEKNSRVFKRSLFVVQDIKAGEVFTSENIRAIRPDDGLHPRHIEDAIGRFSTQAVEKGTPLTWDLVGGKREK